MLSMARVENPDLCCPVTSARGMTTDDVQSGAVLRHIGAGVGHPRFCAGLRIKLPETPTRWAKGDVLVR